jgi:hypothetical protein
MKKLMSGNDSTEGKEDADAAASVIENLKISGEDNKET